MVKISLQIKVTLENIQELRPAGPEFRWYLKVCCSNCREESEKWVYMSLSETVPSQKGHAVNHFVTKCKLCNRENTLTILEDSVKPFVVNDTDEHLEKFQTIVVFDCRGLEPSDFSPRAGWVAKAVDNGKEFTDVDLSEGEWVDYCDIIKQPVGIYDIEYRFERMKALNH